LLLKMGSDPIFPSGILLAAGASRRFGGNKLAHLLDGEPIALRAARALIAALPGAVAVTRPASPLRGPLETLGFRVIECARADEGMGASLAAGVAATRDAAGWVVALADMPFIRSATHEKIARAVAAGADLVAAGHRGERGHPVGIGRRFRDDLLALEGDAGARHIMRANPRLMRLIECDDAGVLRDIDTPADLPPPPGPPGTTPS
jgi:molybdenum cofactor cytidylyltransferase